MKLEREEKRRKKCKRLIHRVRGCGQRPRRLVVNSNCRKFAQMVRNNIPRIQSGGSIERLQIALLKLSRCNWEEQISLEMQIMDVQAGIKSLTSNSKSNGFWTTSQKSVSSTYPRSCLKILCSKKDSNGDNKGDKFSTDWDKAWSNFKKQSKKSLFSGFSPNKYVTWNPKQSNYPLSEEVDPIKRTERSSLSLWTGPGFTLVGAIVIVSFLLLYTILAPVK
ncbi:hypothetical protein V6N13_097108 [Hibiscus sabdariffa]